MCLSGALTCDQYLAALTAAGFPHLEVRARRPYRVLDRQSYGLEADLPLESLDTVSRKGASPGDARQVFTGRRAIYTGPLATVTHQGLELRRHQPRVVSDQMAEALRARWPEAVLVTAPTWRHQP